MRLDTRTSLRPARGFPSEPRVFRHTAHRRAHLMHLLSHAYNHMDTAGYTVVIVHPFTAIYGDFLVWRVLLCLKTRAAAPHCHSMASVTVAIAAPSRTLEQDPWQPYAGKPGHSTSVPRRGPLESVGRGSEFNAGTPYSAATNGARGTPVQSS